MITNMNRRLRNIANPFGNGGPDPKKKPAEAENPDDSPYRHDLDSPEPEVPDTEPDNVITETQESTPRPDNPVDPSEEEFYWSKVLKPIRQGNFNAVNTVIY